MDYGKHNTETDPEQRNNAEKQLSQIHKKIGSVSKLLEIAFQNDLDANGWNGALFTIYKVTQCYKYNECTPLNQLMRHILATIHTLMKKLLNDPSDRSLLLQTHILKIYYDLNQCSLALDLITKAVFSEWFEICTQIVNIDEHRMSCWKVKEWALRIMVGMFERYVDPQHLYNEKYKKLAEWYLSISIKVLEVMRKVIHQYKDKVYVSHRALSYVLQYFSIAIRHSHYWNEIREDMISIITDVIDLIMSLTDDSVPPAAEDLLKSCCEKDGDILLKTMAIIVEKITSINNDDKQKYDALYIIGTLAELLTTEQVYKDQLEPMLEICIFCQFNNPQGQMRAYWVLQQFSKISFKKTTILEKIMKFISDTITISNTNEELSVTVEAAITLQKFLESQEEASPYIKGQIKDITTKLLPMIIKTNSKRLRDVMDCVVARFSEELFPVAVEFCQHLASAFNQALETDNKSHEPFGLLSTIQKFLTVMNKEQPQIMVDLYPILNEVVVNIFKYNTEICTNMFSLVLDLISTSISSEMWSILLIIHEELQKMEKICRLTNLMPVLTKYVKNDFPGFLSNSNQALAIIDMLKIMLTCNQEEKQESPAIGLLHWIILKGKGQVDSYIPKILELVLSMLTREESPSQLKDNCLQVVMSALTNSPSFLNSLLKEVSELSS